MKKVIDTEFLAYQTEIETLLTQALSDKIYRAYLFGSRVTGTSNPASDIDIGILADEPIDLELSLARESLVESTIPFMVDLVDLNRTADTFRAQVLKEGILLWTS